MSEEKDLNTALRCAALEGKLEDVRARLKEGADVQSRNFVRISLFY